MKQSPNENRPANQNLAGPAFILPASSQLSLVGLHPCRAQLRFTG